MLIRYSSALRVKMKRTSSGATKPSEGMGKSGDEAVFSMGLGTHRVPMALHKENRERMVAAMRAAGHVEGVVLLQGGEQECRYDTDCEIVFRQESYFNYLFGVSEPGFYGAVDIKSGEAVLFAPKLHPLYAVWQGEIKPLDHFKTKYAVDKMLWSEELATELKPRGKLYVLHGLNTDSGEHSRPATFEGIESFDVDKTALHPILANCRVYKSQKERELLQYIALTSSLAHVEVMRGTKPGMAEYQLESLFQHHTYTHGGCRHQAYTCICACGPNNAVLHYGHAAAPNDRILGDGDMALLDMGAEYHCYCSDITCSFPVNGKFSEQQRIVYEAVLNAQRAVMERLKPGVTWPDMHRLATHVIVSSLLEAGVLQGTVDELMAAHIGPLFMPHGLGHLIGCDTHDVGGYLPGNPDRCMEDGPSFGICKLRTARVVEEGMYLTVEPGLYFMDYLLDEALADPEKAKFFNIPRLQEFRGMGGVRLEDDVIVTADGVVNLTVCPRTVSEVEGVLAGAPWPPQQDEAPWLFRAWPTKK